MNCESSAGKPWVRMILRQGSTHNVTRVVCFVCTGISFDYAVSTVSFRKRCAGQPVFPIRGEQ